MKVINHAKEKVEFFKLNPGDCFYYDDCLYMKTWPADKRHVAAVNCVCFVDNKICFFQDDVMVTRAEAEVIIHSTGVK